MSDEAEAIPLDPLQPAMAALTKVTPDGLTFKAHMKTIIGIKATEGNNMFMLAHDWPEIPFRLNKGDVLEVVIRRAPRG